METKEKGKKNFDSYTYIEARTGIGQLVKCTCEIGDEEKVKEFFKENVRNIEIPQTKFLRNVSHGGYGQYTRFDVVQHEYAGGGSGFIEVLEIKNPPDERCEFILYERPDGHRKSFSEWETIEDARKAFKRYWCSNESDEKYKKLKGFKRMVKCGLLDPWFYAIGEEALVGDYAFPDGLQDDPVFRFGKKFVVSTGIYENEKMEIKICMGTRIIKRANSNFSNYRQENHDERIVCWDDGTIWSDSFSNSNNQPRELEGDELWIFEAMEEFKKLLSGRKKEFAISFIDGTKFVGKIVPEKGKRIYPEANYYIAVTLKDGTTKKGWVEFKPTTENSDIVSFVTSRFEAMGKLVEKVEIKDQKTEPKGKKWKGVFFNQKKEKIK